MSRKLTQGDIVIQKQNNTIWQMQGTYKYSSNLKGICLYAPDESSWNVGEDSNFTPWPLNRGVVLYSGDIDQLIAALALGVDPQVLLGETNNEKA